MEECMLGYENHFCFFFSLPPTKKNQGANSEGQIGNGECDLEQSPTIIGGLLSHRWALNVACGSSHTLVLTAEGEVYSFGNGGSYQLGLCDKKGRLLPEQIALPSAAIMISLLLLLIIILLLSFFPTNLLYIF